MIATQAFMQTLVVQLMTKGPSVVNFVSVSNVINSGTNQVCDMKSVACSSKLSPNFAVVLSSTELFNYVKLIVLILQPTHICVFPNSFDKLTVH